MIHRAAVRGAILRVAALLLISCAPTLALAGCGSKGHNPIELKLERSDLVSVSRQLLSESDAIEDEIASAHSTWPYIYNGLPSVITRSFQARISASARKMTSLPEPAFLRRIHQLTGPASSMAGLYESFRTLAETGWTMISATVASIHQGPSSTARFRAENVAIYIQSVYDGHYSVSSIGKVLQSGYEKLGGSQVFASELTPTQVETLARLFSPEVARLEPHTTPDLRQ